MSKAESLQELEHILIARVTQPVDLRKLRNLNKVNNIQSEMVDRFYVEG